ncbi:MAG: histidine--tRNA ligase [Verrucomicrobiota bacterium]
MAFQALPGFRDFYPADCAAREWLFSIWRQTAAQCGFSFYDGPPLEPLDLYTTKSGEEIVHQLYNFTDKGERAVSLRPEMTPTLARMAGLRHRDFKKPMKWCAVPQLFRYERAQKGRLREHFQWNCDIIGETSLGAEAELLFVMVSALKKMGLTSEDVFIRLSDRMFWSDFLQKRDVPESKHYEFYQALDKMEREDEETTRKKLGNLADEVLEIFKGGKTPSSPRLDELQSLVTALGLASFVEIDLKIVRGLAYYTGVVFEVHDREREFRAIAGGGRYDHLLKQISGSDLPAAGFGMGDVVILELLKAKNLFPEYKPSLDYFVVIGEEKYRADALNLAAFLREQGKAVDYSPSPAKFGKQFELAEERGARFALIVDEKFSQGKISIKELSTREQKEISFASSSDGSWAFQPALL